MVHHPAAERRNINKVLLVVWLAPALLWAQAANKPAPLTEDRVRVIVSAEAQNLQATLSDLQEKQLNLHRQAFDLRAQAVEQKLDSLKFIGATIAALLGVGLGVAFWAAVKYARHYTASRIEKEVDLAIYKRDPRHWKIHVPRHNFAAERQRLEGLQYDNLEPYDGLAALCKTGITIYRADSDDDLKRLKQFMVNEQIEPLKCFFVIYYTGETKLNLKELAPYDNYAFSNMPSTLSNYIFTASRNLIHG